MFADPKKNIEQFGLEPGQKVADLGSGSGFYSLAAAEVLRGSGAVYAVDVQQDLLTTLSNAARAEKLGVIQTIWGDIEKTGGTKLADKSVDAAIVSNVLFQAESKEGLLKEAFRILKPRGRLLLIDWSDSFGGMGPHPESVVNREAAEKLLSETGFQYEREISAGEHHYGLIYKRP
jgi:ubiquinone/menaquinone biosynthesis C-methylase UbiE